jgi:hypothetical protein
MKSVCDVGKTNIRKGVRMKLKIVLMTCAILACAASSYAVPPQIGNANVAGWTDTVNTTVADPWSAELAWILYSQASPQGFTYNPGAGYWLKNLNTVEPVGADEEINLVEWFSVSGTTLSNWSETCLTPGWVFSTDLDDTWYSTDGGTTKIASGLIYSAGDTKVQIPISPALASGTELVVHTELEWTGAEGGFNDYVQVAQAIPEPCTFVFLALGLAGLFVMRRRLA